MIKACIRTLLIVLLALLQTTSAQLSMDTVFAQMDPSEEPAPAGSVEAPSGEKTDAERFDSLFRQGVDLYRQGEYSDALTIFNAVLAIDEYNTAALTYKKRTLKQIETTADKQRLAAHAEGIAAVDAEWNEKPHAFTIEDEADVTGMKDDAEKQEAERMVARLKAINIPVLDMAEATIEEVVKFFADASRNNKGSGEDVDMLLVGMESAEADNNITISVDDISLYEALQYVAEMASLKFEIKKNLVIIMPANYVPASKMVMKSYNIMPEVGDDLVSGSGASEGATDLFAAPAAGGSASGPVDVSDFFALVEFPEGSSAIYQERFQKLFVKNTPRNLKAVEAVLNDLTEEAIRRRSQQVEIEAKFVEFDEGALSELGFNWTAYGDGSILGMEMDDGRNYYQNVSGYASSETIPQTAGAGDISTTLYTDPVTGVRTIENDSGRRGQSVFSEHHRNNLTAYETVDSGILSRMGGLPAEMMFSNGDVDLRITAMEQAGTADVLSAPRVVTRSGAEAIIRIGETHRYPLDWEPETGQGTPPIVRPQDWDDFDLGFSLTVLPEVDTENRTIELDIRPEILAFAGFDLYPVAINYFQSGGNDESDFLGNSEQLFAQMPAFKRRNVETQVIVADGRTVMMGGLVSERTETFRDQVPFIGDIPYLGRLFRTEGSRTQKVNLTIFVKASLVDTHGMTRADRELARR